MSTDRLEALLSGRAEVLTEIEQAQQRLHDLDNAIMQEMSNLGAEERIVSGHRVRYSRRREWDKDALTPLREIIPETELNGAYIPEHQKTVPPTWDMRRVLPLVRYSDEARRVIENAQYLGPWELRITPVKE